MTTANRPGEQSRLARHRARLIVPVWGPRYVSRFAEVTLPALLALGNLPHLAEHFACEVVVVTERESVEVIRHADSFRRLERFCETTFIEMDDLKSYPAYYGLTITWSLFRGFTGLGAAMTDTWLLFLNADFILADGSYRALVPRMRAGERVILAPSYCTIEEEVLPLLRQRVSPSSATLAIPPRALADLMIDRLHYTVRAKTINRRMYRIEHVDQLYYVVDNNTILARQFPISLVALKPERVLTEPVAIWDFGTLTEACPNARLSVIADSDDFLMLELRSRNVACEQLELGWLNPSAIARDLSVWSTRDQRRCSEHTLVLHRSDLPPNVGEAKHALADFYGRVMAEIRAEPLDHREHPIWVRLQTLHHEWRAASGADGPMSAGAPPDRASEAWAARASEGRPLGERLALIVRTAYRSIFGQVPAVRPVHPYWIDLDPTLASIKAAGEKTRSAIAVWSTPRALVAPRLKERFADVRECRPDEIASNELPPLLDEATAADLAFVELTREEILEFRQLHARLRRRVRRGGRIIVLYRTHGVEVLAPRDISFIVGALPTSDVAVVWFRGSRLTSWLQRRWDEMLAGIRKRRRIGAIRFVTVAILTAPVTYLANQNALRRSALGEVPRGCTSVCIEITVL